MVVFPLPVYQLNSAASESPFAKDRTCDVIMYVRCYFRLQTSNSWKGILKKGGGVVGTKMLLEEQVTPGALSSIACTQKETLFISHSF